MIIYEEETIEVRTPVGIVCDKCHVIYEDELDLQEFLKYKHSTGYNSAFGDLNIVEVDICSNCLKEMIGDICRINSIY